MNKVSGILIICVMLLGCKKEDLLTKETGFISVINAVPGAPLAVFIDTAFQVRIPYRAASRNLQLIPGPHIISITDSVRLKTYLALSSIDFAKDETSTLIVYDTLHPVDSTVKAIRLTDDLTLAPPGFVKVRFIHAAPQLAPVDVTFLRTGVTTVDSLTFSMQTFIGNSPNIPALSAFNTIPIGAYTLKVKAAGTQDTVMNTLKLSVSNLAGVAGISGITTFYLTGNAQGQPLEINRFRHYP